MEGFKVILLDCYGTLVDWERGMYENLGPLFAQKTCPSPEVIITALVEEQIRLQNGDKTMPYPIVLEEAYRQIVATYRLHYDPEAAQALGQSVPSWPLFDDSADCLARLKALGMKLVILVNGDDDSFERLRPELEAQGGVFDAAYTAEHLGCYKPDLRTFGHVLEHLLEKYDIVTDQVICVAQSKLVDIEPANKLGIATARINRDRAITGHTGTGLSKANFEFKSLEQFTEEMERVHRELVG